ncbi:hypothetical protein F4810DRAFT_685935 [Camillea tinctor]|nr:hypothetical protein F4810DRAFT_685935 [Camillea tinctor]
MISGAKKIGGTTGSGEPIRFEVSSAEDLSGISDNSIDLITAATAAHWFNMPTFWARAAQVLKPGGSVGLWTYKSTGVADSVPNAEAIQAALDTIRKENLAPYTLPGNLLSRELYGDLILPWTADPIVAGFDKENFFRTEWGTGTEGALPGGELLAGGYPEADMDTIEAMMGTASPIVRWREANKEKVGTEQDIVRMMRREIERLLHEAGVEKGKEIVKGSASGVLLLVKKGGG